LVFKVIISKFLYGKIINPMKTRNLKRISVLIIISLFLYSCPPSPELPGDIKGLVTDAETSEPIYKAKVGLNTTDDTTRTGIDGSYLLKNIDPDNYESQASKFGYKTETENVTVKSALTKEINFSLTKVVTINVSNNLLDFGIDSTSLKFNISKAGSGTLAYNISTSQSWLTTSSPAGYITEETDTITVTVNINRTDLVKRKYKETIIVSDIGETQQVKIDVYLNGIWIDSKYVYIVRIGAQVWMGENLNVGKRIDGAKDQTDNKIIEKYCYDDNEDKCNSYGGLYQWDEMMQYNPVEDTTKIPGTTKGICPDGWHIPTAKEWRTLQAYFGGAYVAGGALKEAGTIHWTAPNTGATNESGFTGLPGGGIYKPEAIFDEIGTSGYWWSSSPARLAVGSYMIWPLYTENTTFMDDWSPPEDGLSVRCIRNP
jgi:uncharacterized protein (TIGR02145 family)